MSSTSRNGASFDWGNPTCPTRTMGGPPAGWAGHFGSTAYAGAAGGAFASGRTHAAFPDGGTALAGVAVTVPAPAPATPSDLAVAVAARGSGAARSQPTATVTSKESAKRGSMASPVSIIIAALWKPGLHWIRPRFLDPSCREARLPATHAAHGGTLVA